MSVSVITVLCLESVRVCFAFSRLSAAWRSMNQELLVILWLQQLLSSLLQSPAGYVTWRRGRKGRTEDAGTARQHLRNISEDWYTQKEREIKRGKNTRHTKLNWICFVWLTLWFSQWPGAGAGLCFWQTGEHQLVFSSVWLINYLLHIWLDAPDMLLLRWVTMIMMKCMNVLWVD